MFVPYVAPGDRVVARVVDEHPGYVRARAEAVVHAGRDRVLPGCRFFPACGGCQWQQVAPAAQRAAKQAIVAEQLARLGGIREADVRPVLAPSDDWAYRARITLVVEGRRAGYHRARSHALVEIAECPIADPALSEHLAVARVFAASLRAPLTRLTVARAADGVVLVARAGRAPGAGDVRAAEDVLGRVPSVRGIVIAGGHARWVGGDPTVRVPLEADLELEVPADVFTQVSPAANRAMVATVLALGRFGAGERVLDLYCGAGNFALPIARRGASVHGIERNAVAVGAAVANAARLGLPVTFEESPVADALLDAAPGSADGVILDPPRAGAAESLVALAALRAPRMVYVSCDPATFARDVRQLLSRGYSLGAVQPIDAFPQTYHIETVAELRLT